jgi:hypothetical protein
MASLIYFHASAATSFSLTIIIPNGVLTGGGQLIDATGCRPGLWEITYSNSWSGGSGVDNFLESISTQYGLNPANGFTELYSPVYQIATFELDGTVSGFRAPATNPSANVYQSYLCSVIPVTFRLRSTYTLAPGGVTLSANGTWLTSCG